MNKDIRKFITLLSALILTNTLFGQIWYKLDLLEDGETYQVSLISEKDWGLPNNITSTGQITIKTPTLEFDIVDFESVQPKFTWKYNSRYNAPEESSDFDYFSFGLEQASRDFDYEAGEEVPIIRFKNAKGCSDFIGLIDNATDPLIYSTTKKVNIGNQLTVVGARGNAYKGNKGAQLIKCNKQIIQKDQFLKDFTLYPNPAFNEVNVNLNWTASSQGVQFFIRNNEGKVVINQAEDLVEGRNEILFDIAQLPGGIYYIELSNANKESISLDRFVKVYSASLDLIKGQREENPRAKNK